MEATVGRLLQLLGKQQPSPRPPTDLTHSNGHAGLFPHLNPRRTLLVRMLVTEPAISSCLPDCRITIF